MRGSRHRKAIIPIKGVTAVKFITFAEKTNLPVHIAHQKHHACSVCSGSAELSPVDAPSPGRCSRQVPLAPTARLHRAPAPQLRTGSHRCITPIMQHHVTEAFPKTALETSLCFYHSNRRLHADLFPDHPRLPFFLIKVMTPKGRSMFQNISFSLIASPQEN